MSGFGLLVESGWAEWQLHQGGLESVFAFSRHLPGVEFPLLLASSTRTISPEPPSEGSRARRGARVARPARSQGPRPATQLG